jgi:hypothetical protein
MELIESDSREGIILVDLKGNYKMAFIKIKYDVIMA